MSCILIVEDNSANAKLLREILIAEQHEVLTVGDADSGLVVARERRPDLILMDIQLPGTDGITATRLLKTDPATQDIPVIALTAHAMRGDEERILAAGCDRYLAKPIRYKALLEVLKDYL